MTRTDTVAEIVTTADPLAKAQAEAQRAVEALTKDQDALAHPNPSRPDTAATALSEAQSGLRRAEGQLRQVVLLTEAEWESITDWARGDIGIDPADDDESPEETAQVWECYRAEERERLQSLAQQPDTRVRAQLILAQWDDTATHSIAG